MGITETLGRWAAETPEIEAPLALSRLVIRNIFLPTLPHTDQSRPRP